MTVIHEPLQHRLAEYDGKSAGFLEETAHQFAHDLHYIETLVALAAAPIVVVSDGATWLIKHHVDRGGTLSGTQTSALIRNISKITSWAAILHVCQTVRHLSIANTDAKSLVTWLTPLLSHKRPFIRAWSLDALCAVADHDAKFREIADRALKTATQDIAASVRARARNLSK